MEEKKKHYKVIVDERDGSYAEKKMNEFAEQGYRFVEMSTNGTSLHLTIIMEKED